MKRALARAEPWVRARSGRIVLWVHDEFQAECHEDDADDVGRALQASIVDAGHSLNLRVRIDADYKVGPTWADTH
ncbi:MAG: hypothetical protein GWN71_21755 [Gammaproteobacteria bacterium]|nr:hypothetical protein [Gemmatimonadota bacterium]NIR35068.1 hypothetical protein [Actinomycetota bacterium]NIU76094.1 hypothetical protein [Gammaproteobacteria bacterium]NIY09945.1 hypothetical protein [Gemmatimonadota bacterium]